MNTKQSPTLTRRIIGGVVVIALVGLISASVLIAMNSMDNRSNWPAQFQSNGERIYFTVRSASGQAIIARGGQGHFGMMGGGCVACHGADRLGGRSMSSFWKTAPPLTAEALFKTHSETGHGDHEGYSEETLSRAITQGIQAGGEQLDQVMPRWSMSEPDLADLIAFLKTSGARH